MLIKVNQGIDQICSELIQRGVKWNADIFKE